MLYRDRVLDALRSTFSDQLDDATRTGALFTQAVQSVEAQEPHEVTVSVEEMVACVRMHLLGRVHSLLVSAMVQRSLGQSAAASQLETEALYETERIVWLGEDEAQDDVPPAMGPVTAEELLERIGDLEAWMQELSSDMLDRCERLEKGP